MPKPEGIVQVDALTDTYVLVRAPRRVLVPDGSRRRPKQVKMADLKHLFASLVDELGTRRFSVAYDTTEHDYQLGIIFDPEIDLDIVIRCLAVAFVDRGLPFRYLCPELSTLAMG